MFNRLRFDAESDDVYVALVGELFTSWVPVSIMGAIVLGVGLFIGWSLASPIVCVAATAGCPLTIAKIGLMLVCHQREAAASWDRPQARAWERAHGITTLGFAASVGVIGVITFRAPDLALQMLATGLLFGYCSGVVARMSSRPRLAMLAECVAAVPVIAMAALGDDPAHLKLAGVFAAILAGSFETVRHVHHPATRQIAMRLDMATIARNDPLTGLANRLGLREAFRVRIGIRPDLPMIAVHCFDLDGFKSVNDRFGHPAGDKLLTMIAENVRAMLRPGDIAARIGGDEFVVVQSHIRHADEADMFARRLARAVTRPLEIAGQAVSVGVSLGYATSPPDDRDLDELLGSADAALYRMKHHGGGVARGDQTIAIA